MFQEVMARVGLHKGDVYGTGHLPVSERGSVILTGRLTLVFRIVERMANTRGQIRDNNVSPPSKDTNPTSTVAVR